MTATASRIDVRTIAPRDRHPLIFSTFAQLPAGSAMELVNDHDPRPLYLAFNTQLAGQFAWNYLEQGPETWRVAITRVKPAGSSCCSACG